MNKTRTEVLNKSKKNTVKSFFQQLGSALIIPVLILPIAGLFIGISSLIPLNEGTVFIKNLLETMSLIIINNLSTLYLISILHVFSQGNRDTIIWGLLFYIIGISIQSSIIDGDSILFYDDLNEYYFSEVVIANTLNQTSELRYLNMSVFGGIIYSFVFLWVYKIVSNFNLKSDYAIFIYKPLIYISASILFSVLMCVVWPFFNYLIFSFGNSLVGLPYGTDAFIYGFSNRLLLPVGMHTLLITPMLYSSMGGTLINLDTGAVLAEGDTLIWLYALNNNIPFDVIREANTVTGEFVYNSVNYYVSPGLNPGQYIQGFTPVMVFGFPMAGYAMTKRIENKSYKRIIMLAAFTPLLTGVTEPFEFLFLFTFPLLYLSHAILVGLSFMILDLTDTSIWLSSGWIFDLFLFGILPAINNMNTNFWNVFILGAVYAVFYYFIFNYFYNVKKVRNDQGVLALYDWDRYFKMKNYT